MELTPKQEAFCVHYAQHREPAAAYRHAYDVAETTSHKTCTDNGYKLTVNTACAQRIKELTKEASRVAKSTFDTAKCMDAWAQIVTANPDELIGLRVGCCRYCHGVDHKYQWKEREYLEAMDEAQEKDLKFPDLAGGLGFTMGAPPVATCPECNGEGVRRVRTADTSKLSAAGKALYGGVKVKADGSVEIIIADRTKALENLTRMLGGYKDNVKLDSSITLMAQLLQMTDPNEAAKAYQELIRSNVS